jgi:hypothetical protein
MPTRSNAETQLDLNQVLAQFMQTSRSMHEQMLGLQAGRSTYSRRNKHLYLFTGNKYSLHYTNDCPLILQARQIWIEKAMV